MEPTTSGTSPQSQKQTNQQSKSEQKPNDQQARAHAGGLKIRPSSFNQRVSENSIAWAADRLHTLRVSPD